MPTQSCGGSFSQCGSGGAPPKRSQASASRARSGPRSGFSRANPSTRHGPFWRSSKTLTASNSPNASVAAAAASASGAANTTRHSAPARRGRSGFGDKAVHHHLVAGLIERDGELAVVRGAHRAVAEFLVKNAIAGDIADRRARRLGGHEARRLGAAAETRRARAPGFLQAWRARVEPGLGNGFDVILRQFADEARGQGTLPLAAHAPIGGIRDESAPPRPREPDISKPALFLESFEPRLVHRALVRKEALLPAGQEDIVEFEAFGAVQGHEADHVAAGFGGVLHDEADVIEEPAEAVEFSHRRDQLFEVFEPTRRVGRFIRLPHRRVARFVENLSGEIGMGGVVEEAAPAVEIGSEGRERTARGRLQLVGADENLRRIAERHFARPRERVQSLQGRGADAALRHVDDALESEVVRRLMDEAQIGQRIADFLPLGEPQAADYAIGEAEGQESLFDLAGLETGADED